MNRLISIVIPTLNNAGEIEKFFASVNKQNYPKSKIEIIASDGGSQDSTNAQLKKRGATVIHNPFVLAEPGVSLGMEKANGDLIMILAMDNFFKDSECFNIVNETFLNSSVFAAFPKQDFDPSDNLFTKYHNTFTDPFNHFVNGEASNARTFHRVYKTLAHNQIYDIYDFYNSRTIPMISLSQGFTIRRSFERNMRDRFDDNSPIISLIKNKKNIAYIHSLSIYHHTIKNLAHFIKKQRWATRNALEKKNYGISHRIGSLSPEQQIRIKLWPFYALSVILPVIDSINGLLKDKNLIWLFHPVNCLICAYANAVELLVFLTGRIGFKTDKISRQ